MDRAALDSFITLHEREIFDHSEPIRKWSELTPEEKKHPSSLDCSISTDSEEEFQELHENLLREDDV